MIEILDEWKGKLTWDLLLNVVKEKTGISYSRFTFAEYPRIANAFTLRKKALSGTWTGEPSQPRDAQVRAALEQAERYRVKADRLEQENRLLLEQFVTWATNAERKGVTMAMLNAPLRKPNRDSSEDSK
ncbi:hypothetical protein [Piscinibacter gummiphilus]|uniref:hypothetical protein n=1 Tax=Piscinibacter gummiphilus TaxID=946333 RepID=UPI001F3697E1|nr:hypothetical protein [Piscinibacter gummiphilus]